MTTTSAASYAVFYTKDRVSTAEREGDGPVENQEVRLKARGKRRVKAAYGFLAEKLNEMPAEMAAVVLFESSGLDSVRPNAT